MKTYKKENEKSASNSKEVAPEVCKNCLRWEKFGKNCYVYWEGKKFCTRKVLTMEEWAKKEIMI